MKKIETIDDVEAFLLKHGENIVDMLGGEIDRIELKLRVCYICAKNKIKFECHETCGSVRVSNTSITT